MITPENVIEKILAHLNGRVSEDELVLWAEDAFVQISELSQDIPNESLLLDVLGYIGAGDTAGFPLKWSVLAGFLEQLGAKVQVTVV